ncbi:hypothetical protein MYRNA_182 [Mycobacterium phage Myrna]|uniref:NadR/Ttd14 AAA domain-containing protein n=1 Tax=Mycobacterium phage Myrna TaxID=546805 RepID=B5LJF4_9CAUD|nr:thymidylate kinase [Mycobacterium phage Myrna]ACH62151.1 hypothetical protein MYRNA_182 [Mycobacterium phage Myrna]
MTLVKVALTGTHGVGKTFIVDNVAALALNEGWQVNIVYSPTRRVKKLGAAYGMKNNMDGDWHFQWHVMSQTQLRAWEAEEYLTEFSSAPDAPKLIIGDRCLWDPCAYTADLLHRIAATSIASADAHRRKNLLEDVYRLGHLTASTDTFWDRVFFKPHHPDHLTPDPDRLDDRDYQLAVEKRFEEILEGRDVGRLDIDRNVAVDELWKWISDQAS